MCDVCGGSGVIQNNMGKQQPCWQCNGSGVGSDESSNNYYDDDDDD